MYSERAATRRAAEQTMAAAEAILRTRVFAIRDQKHDENSMCHIESKLRAAHPSQVVN